MMSLKILLKLVAVISLSYQVADTSNISLRQLEQALTARLRWEVLWNDMPQGFLMPKSKDVRLAVYWTVGSIWYCSRDLGVCAQYSLEGRHLGQRNKFIKYNNADDDIDSVSRFAGQKPKSLFPSEIGTSQLPQFTGTLWTRTIELGSREEVVASYKKLRPTKLKGLRDWLRERLKDGGFRSVTIASFAPSDPTVFIHGDRTAERGGPIVFQVFWDSEREAWVYAGMLEQAQDPERFERLKVTIQAIACETVRLHY